MIDAASGRTSQAGNVGRRLCRPLAAAILGSALAIFWVGLVSVNQAQAQVGGGTYAGGLLDEGDNQVGTIKVTVSENAAAVTSIEFVNFDTNCENLGIVNREMELDVPPVLTFGVGLFLGEFEAEEEPEEGEEGFSFTASSIFVDATFVSDQELRGVVSVSFFSESLTFPTPPADLSPPGFPEPVYETESCDEEFSFVASLVTPPPTPTDEATEARTDTPPVIALPDTGSGAATGGTSGATPWAVLAVVLGALGLATTGLAVVRQRCA